MSKRKGETLAIDGGAPVVSKPPAPRGLLTEKEKAAVVQLFDQAIASGQAIGYNGSQEEAYCEAFAKSLGGGYADGVNSGSNAVFVALKALDLPPFSEVVVPPISDPGGVMPVPLNNLIPVPADAAPGSFNAGPEQIAERITPRTSAILVAHICGEPVDMAPVMQLARKHKLAVVEDCAQAHGATYRGKPVGTIGDVGAFSTMFGKHHCTGGQGGLVFTKKKALYWKVRQCADRGKPFGLKPGRNNVVASLNMNMDELGACIGRVQLAKLPKIVARRRAVAERILEGTSKLKAVHAPAQPKGSEPSYWFLRLGLDASLLAVDKSAFCKALRAEIQAGVDESYRAVPAEQPWFVEKRVFGEPGLPWTAPQYEGDPDQEYPLPNTYAAIEGCFRIAINEAMTVSFANQVVKALAKVERAYLQV